MSGLATGAERVYLHEEGVTLRPAARYGWMIRGFMQGKRLSLVIRNEYANRIYTTGFMCALFEEEGGGLFDVRQASSATSSRAATPRPSTASRPPAWRAAASTT